MQLAQWKTILSSENLRIRQSELTSRLLRCFPHRRRWTRTQVLGYCFLPAMQQTSRSPCSQNLQPVRSNSSSLCLTIHLRETQIRAELPARLMNLECAGGTKSIHHGARKTSKFIGHRNSRRKRDKRSVTTSTNPIDKEPFTCTNADGARSLALACLGRVRLKPQHC